jgi:alpha-L-rhamnosidase
MLTITSASILFVQHPALAYSWRKSYEGEQLQGARKQSGLSAGKTFLVQFIFPLLIAPFFSLAQTPVHREPSDLGVESLTCNTAVNPLGVDDALPRFHWSLKPRTELLRGERQTAFQILVASSRAQLDHDSGDLWDSTKKPGALTPQVFYAGEPLESDIVYFWKVRVWDQRDRPSAWSETATFLTGLLQSSDWHGHWIAAVPDGPRRPQARGTDGARAASTPPLPIFRSTFSVNKPVARATLFLSGLGQSEAMLNGKPVTQALLTPGWTDYRKTVLYETYDVTRLLRAGANAIGVMLGNGMYNVEGVQGRYTKFIGSFGQPKLIAELRLHYADGSTSIVSSSDRWKTTNGPILFTSIYGGEDYDARRRLPGWTLPTFDDAAWEYALLVDGPGGELRAEKLPPVEIIKNYAPLKVNRISPDLAVYDLGKNFAGRPAITVSGPRGSTVRVLPGELLDSSGRVTQASQGASPDSPVVLNYTLAGDGVEHWSPQFTYSGFRYAEVAVSAKDGLPGVRGFEGQAIHDAVSVDGSFTSSNDLLNRIHNLINAAIQNNMVSVLTDCPTREKLGWLEQTHLAGPSILYNYNLSLLYRKMAGDMRDSQTSGGMVPAIAPEVVAFLDESGHNTDFRDSPEWGSAIILSPWTAYTFYGDKQVLRGNYDAMVAYAHYLATRANNDLLSYGLGDWYDIGPGAPGRSQLTGEAMTATAIYFQDLTALARIAAILNKTADAAEFTNRAAAVKASINAHLFHPETNNYDKGSQTANAMALALDLVPEDHRAGVLTNLVADIRHHNNHVTAGDIGFHYLVRALTDSGRSDVLYDMLTRNESPSYGYQLSRGATTLTEAWNANPDSSQDHFMLGHAEEWFYRGLAGIDFDLDRAVEARIWIHPQVVGDLQSVSASYKSVLGLIVSRWQREADTFHFDITIPPGVTATISFPPEFGRGVKESGHDLRGDDGVLSVNGGSGPLSIVVASGNYHFVAQR